MLGSIFNQIRRLPAILGVANGGTGGGSQNAAAKALATPYVLAQSSVAVTCPADTAKNTLATIVIPAGAMGANGRVEIDCTWTVNNNANNKILRAEIGATAYLASTVTAVVGVRTTTVISNRNSQSSQVTGAAAAISYGGSTTGVVTSAIDMSAQQSLIISGQKAVGGDTLILESYCITVYPRD